MSKIIGIDLGTTNSCVSYMTSNGPKVIPNAEGANTTPSIVALTQDGSRVVGVSAKNQAVLNPQNTFFSIKRFIGRSYDNEDVQRDIKLVPYAVRKSSSGGIEVNVNGEWMSPEAVSAMILAKLKADAEAYLGEPVTKAVITVPAYFDDSERQATKNAGKIAGLEVERIINEPTAAALAYGLDKKTNEVIAVYDLGGGTFDVTILDIGDGVFEVLSTNGDTHLGGDDFDQVVINYLADEFKKTNGIDLRDDKAALQRLKEAAEKAKIELSSLASTQINIPFITADASGPKHLNITISRAKLEELVEPLVKKTLEPVKKALTDAGKDVKDINEVVMVGGMTRMPKIIETVKKFFGKEPHKGVNPDEVVAIGAAIQGGVITGDVSDITLLDVTPLSIGLETEGGVMTKLIERNTTIPVEKKQVFSTAADNQSAVDIRILQGEREMANDNKQLGTFRLDGVRSAPRGIPRIEVSFDIDANGILKVTAKDLDTNKSQDITITASTNLSDEEVDKLVKEAAAHAAEDKAKKEKAVAKNEADTQIYAANKLIDEGKLEATDKEELLKLKDDLQESIISETSTKSEVEEKTNKLKDKVIALSEKVGNKKEETEKPKEEAKPDEDAPKEPEAK